MKLNIDLSKYIITVGYFLSKYNWIIKIQETLYLEIDNTEHLFFRYYSEHETLIMYDCCHTNSHDRKKIHVNHYLINFTLLPWTFDGA